MRQPFEVAIPALDSVFIMMLIGFRASFWEPLPWMADRSWLSIWLAPLVESPLVEALLAVLESLLESEEAAWA